MKTLNSVDVAKIIMSLCVVAIHVQALYIKVGDQSLYPFLVEWLIRLAVPFFFVASGWLIRRKYVALDPANAGCYLKSKGFKTLRILGLWLLVYLPIAVLHFFDTHTPWLTAIKTYSLNIIISGTSYFAFPLWYLYAVAVGVFALWLASNCRWLMMVICVVFLFSYLVARGCIHLPLTGTVGYAINLICAKPLGGGIYLFAGWFLHNIKFSPFIKNITFASLCIAISLLLGWRELPFGELFGGLGVFIFCLAIRLRENGIYNVLRAESMWIYFTHAFILFWLNRWLMFKAHHFPLYTTLAILAIASSVVSLALYRISIRFPRIRFLIG